MNDITEKQNRQEHALAQLLVHAPSNNSVGDGPEVTLEELAMLTEGKLNEQRRQEVLGQLDSNPMLYETWTASQEMAQQAESLSITTASEPKTIVKPDAISLIDQITHFLSDLLSWQGAFATSFGIALGVILVSQSGLDSANDPDIGQGIVMHAPVDSPQKASVEQLDTKTASVMTPEIANIEVIRVEGNTVYLKVTLNTGEVIEETYTYKQNGTKNTKR